MGSESVKTAGDSGQACDLTDVSVEELRGSSSRDCLRRGKRATSRGCFSLQNYKSSETPRTVSF